MKQRGYRPVWAIEWYSRNAMDGVSRYLVWSLDSFLVPLVFATRREARACIKAEYGYIAKRRDLRSEPHGWRVPKAVRVRVSVDATR